MTVADVNRTLDEIRAAATQGDYEKAHSIQDRLVESVLEAITLGRCDEPVLLAGAAYRVYEIDFERWCA